MQSRIWWTSLFAISLGSTSFVGGCGGDTTSGTAGTGGVVASSSTVQSTSSTSSGATSSGSTSTSTGGQGGAGGGPALVNGCDPATAINRTKDANIDVQLLWKDPVGDYDPRCVIVAKGSTVTFVQDPGVAFNDHALAAGTKVDGTAASDPTSPIPAWDAEPGMPLVVHFIEAGSYGFYCPYHGYLGERGAIFVQ